MLEDKVITNREIIMSNKVKIIWVEINFSVSLFKCFIITFSKLAENG